MNIKSVVIATLAVIGVVGAYLLAPFVSAFPKAMLPFLALLALVIWPLLLVEKRPQFRVRIGTESRSLVSSFLAATAISAVFYLFLSSFFGVKIASVEGWEGIKGLLADPSQIRDEVLKVVLVFGATYSLFWLWFKQRHERLWLFRLVLVGCIFFLMFPKFNPVTALQQGWEQVRETKEDYLPEPREEIRVAAGEARQQFADAQAEVDAWKIQMEADRLATRAGIQDIVRIPAGFGGLLYTPVKVVDQEGNEVVKMIKPEQPEVGSEWIVHRNILFWSGNSAMHYVQIVNRRDENIIRAIRKEYLLELELVKHDKQQESGEVRVASIASPPPSTSVSSPVLTPAIHEEVQFSVNQDIVFLTEKDWVAMDIFPEDGDLIDIRSGDSGLLSKEQLSKVMIRSGNAALGEIRLNFPENNGMAYGLTRIEGGNPVMLAADGTLTKSRLRLKLAAPGGFSVQVTRIPQPKVNSHPASLR